MKKPVLQIPVAESADLPDIGNVSGTALYNSTDGTVQSISSGYAAIKLNADSSDYVNYGGILISSADSTLGSEDSLIQLQAIRNGSLTNWQAYQATTNTIYLGFTGTTYNLPGFATNTLLATNIDQNIIAASGTYSISISGNAATVTTNANLTGDVTSVGNATTLATVNSNIGSFGSSSQVPVFTVNGKGLITAVTNTTISGVAPGGAAGGDLSSSYPNPTVSKINGVSLGSTTATAGNLLIGSGSAWVSQPTSGDVTINSSGVTAIGSSKVTNTMLAGSIADTKLLTISTSGKVSNSATTATSANTASAIVTRDPSGNFSAGTITASLSGNATSATTAATATGLAISGTGNQSGSIRSTTTGGSGNVSLVLNRADVLSASSVTYQINGSTEYLAGPIAGSNYYMIQNGSGSNIFQLSSAGDVFFPSVAGAVTLTTSSGQLYGAIGTAGQPLRMTNGVYAEFGSLDLAAGSSVFTGILPGDNGGTGVANTGKTITIGGNVTYSGAFAFTGTLTNTTSVTFPTSGTLATTSNTVASITGTANQVLANSTSGSAQTGAVTLTLPQSIATTSIPQFGGLNISGTGAVFETITSTTTGSMNEGGLNLVRGDQANGYAQTHYKTGATDIWATGLRTLDAKYHIYDVVNSIDTVVITGGTGTTSTMALAGSLTVNAGFTVNNTTGSSSQAGSMGGFNSIGSPSASNLFGVQIQKTGTDVVFLGVNKNTTTGAVPPNACYISGFGSGSKISIGRGDGTGLPSSADILLNGDGTVTFGSSITTTGNATLNSGDAIINTAGKTLKIKQGSNACAGTGVTLVGGTATVTTSAVATGDIIHLNCTAAGGTQGIVRTSISNGASFTITSSNGADTSTYSWDFIKAA